MAGAAVVALLLTGCATPTVPGARPADATTRATPKPTPGQTDIRVIEMVSASYAYDVSDVKEVASHSASVVVATVERIGDRAEFPSNDGSFPETEVIIRVDEKLKGEAPPAGVIIVQGGVVTEQEAFEAMPLERAQKSGLADRSVKERESSLVRFVTAAPADLAVGETYLMMLKTDPERGVYALGADGYAVFRQDGSTFTNMITRQKLTTEDLRDLLG
ncbi:hypothetical protein [Microbacterium sp.]|uniref:hypothetical protein n=1 Tax=Microbacterium sp. TaxID=51671 RepID=UPI0039E5C8DF